MSDYFTTCTAANAIETRGDSWLEPMAYLSGTTGIGGVADIKTAYRVHTPSTVEYIGLSWAAARAYVLAHPGTCTYTAATVGPPAVPAFTTITRCRWERDGNADYYKVVVDTEIITAWTQLVTS